jgi:hypothetical protein
VLLLPTVFVELLCLLVDEGVVVLSTEPSEESIAIHDVAWTFKFVGFNLPDAACGLLIVDAINREASV